MQSNLKEELGLKYPVFWSDWAIEPKLAECLIYLTITKRPGVIVDLGSGLSTLFLSKVSNDLGLKNKIYSVDSDEEFLKESKALLEAEGIFNKDRNILVHAPIEKIALNGFDQPWYKMENDELAKEVKIDMLLVDGPYGGLCKKSRYPAVPFFKDKLKNGSIIILDDYNREDEQEIMQEWSRALKSNIIIRAQSAHGFAEIVVGR